MSTRPNWDKHENYYRTDWRIYKIMIIPRLCGQFTSARIVFEIFFFLAWQSKWHSFISVSVHEKWIIYFSRATFFFLFTDDIMPMLQLLAFVYLSLVQANWVYHYGIFLLKFIWYIVLFSKKKYKKICL